MNQIIQTYKPLIDARLKELCNSTQDSSIPWASDVAERLYDFCQRGKTVRGCMILYTNQLFQKQESKEAIDIATCVELLHAALLIHDDIIDHDRLRRGIDSMHVQYEKLGEHKNVSDPKKFGEGMAMCVGDIAIFGAFSFLTQIKLAPDVHQQVMKTITREFLTVGFGELHDIALGFLPNIPSSDEVLSMYMRKTARYTFSLPLMLGAILTKQPETTIQTLEKLGETLGLIFQLRDDELTLYGTLDDVGKPIGNDIVENKNTLFRVLLFERISSEDRVQAEGIFGKATISQSEIKIIHTLFSKYNVDRDIQKHIESLSTNAEQLISTLPLSQEKKEEFRNILAFLKKRTR